MIKLGHTAKKIREAQGLTQRAAAEKLGISVVHLCNIERNNAAPSRSLVERYQELWGVDLYILAWCLFGEESKLPERIRAPMRELAEAWKAELSIQGFLDPNEFPACSESKR